MRFRFRTLVIIFLLGMLAGLAIDFLRPRKHAVAGAREEIAARVSMDRRIPEIDLINLPLDQATKRVAETLGVAIEVDTADLKSHGVPLDKKVTIRLQNVPAGELLDRLTEAFSAAAYSGSRNYVFWYWSENRIVITTDQGKLPTAQTCVYDVGDILSSSSLPGIAQGFEVVPPDNDPQTGTVISDNTLTARRKMLDTALDGVIFSSLWPGGGSEKVSQLRPDIPVQRRIIGDVLIVTHTPEGQARIRYRLRELRRILVSAELRESADAVGTRVWDVQSKNWRSTSSFPIEEKLGRKASQFQISQASFVDALKIFGRTFEVPIEMEFSLAEDIHDSIQVSLSQRDIAGYSALRALLLAAAEQSSKVIGRNNYRAISRLDWTIDDGKIVVVDADHTPKQMRWIRMYDLRKWINAGPDSYEERCARIKAISMAMLRSCSPDVSNLNDKWPGYDESDGFLFVSQTFEEHRLIRRFLDSYRPPTETKLGAATAGK